MEFRKEKRPADQDLFLIEGMAVVQGAPSTLVLFDRASIAYITPQGDDKSRIVLSAGPVLDLALSFDALKAKLYSNDDVKEGEVLNLCDLATTSVVAPASAPVSVAESFTQKAKPPAGLKIHASFRKSSDPTYMTLDIDDAQIDWANLESLQSMVTKAPATKVTFRPGVRIQGVTALNIDMPIDEFRAAATLARDNREAMLDLTTPERPMLISAFVRPVGKGNYVPFTFADNDINWKKLEGSDGFNGKPCIVIPLKSGNSPFGSFEKMVLEMSLDKFMETYTALKLKDVAKWDLRPKTRHKAPWFQKRIR